MSTPTPGAWPSAGSSAPCRWCTIDAGVVSWNGPKPNFSPPVKLLGKGKLSARSSGKIAIELVILCCVSSALIKLPLTEPGSDQMHQASIEAVAIAVCRIAWAEAKPLEQARQQLIENWEHCSIVELSQGLVDKAGRFVDAFCPARLRQCAARRRPSTARKRRTASCSSWRCCLDRLSEGRPSGLSH